MKKRCDDERRKLNALESELWTNDPEFYRQFDHAWSARRGHETAGTERAASALWMLPIGLIVSGVILCVVVVQAR